MWETSKSGGVKQVLKNLSATIVLGVISVAVSFTAGFYLNSGNFEMVALTILILSLSVLVIYFFVTMREDTNQGIREMRRIVDNSESNDIIIENIERVLKIEEAKDGLNFTIISTMRIRNLTEDQYDYFTFQSTGDGERPGACEVFIDNKKQDETRYTVSTSYICKECKKITQTQYDLKVLLELGPNKTCSLKIVQDVNASYRESREMKRDFIGGMVRHQTERLRLVVELNTENYEFVEAALPLHDCEVLDGTKTHASRYESRIIDRGECLHYAGNKLEWTIWHPKTGYTFRTFFKLVRSGKGITN